MDFLLKYGLKAKTLPTNKANFALKVTPLTTRKKIGTEKWRRNVVAEINMAKFTHGHLHRKEPGHGHGYILCKVVIRKK